MELFGSTAGKPNAPGSRLPPLPEAPPASQKGLVVAKVMLAASVARVLVILRTFPPNCKVCLPLVQVTSSTKLCTGMWNLVVNDVEGERDPTLGCRSSRKRKLT